MCVQHVCESSYAQVQERLNRPCKQDIKIIFCGEYREPNSHDINDAILFCNKKARGIIVATSYSKTIYNLLTSGI